MNKFKYKILKTLDSSDEPLYYNALLNKVAGKKYDVNILKKHLDDLVFQELIRYENPTHEPTTSLNVTPKGRDYIDYYVEFKRANICSYIALVCSFISVAIAFCALRWVP